MMKDHTEIPEPEARYTEILDDLLPTLLEPKLCSVEAKANPLNLQTRKTKDPPCYTLQSYPGMRSFQRPKLRMQMEEVQKARIC